MFVKLFTLAILLSAIGTAQNTRFAITFRAASPTLKDHPAMVSAIRNGAVVRQTEFLLAAADSYTNLDDLAPGMYDVRVEGEGFVTEVKRGVQLFPAHQGELAFVLRPGTGVHVVEYAAGGLAREEVAARLQKLESAVAELRKTTAK